MRRCQKMAICIAFTCIVNVGVAQIPIADSIVNGGFEIWKDIPNTFGGQDPEHWTSTNKVTAGSNLKGIAKTTDAYSGAFALELTPLISGDSNQFRTSAVVLGVAKLNGSDFSIDYDHSGVPYRSNIPYLTGFYKYIPDTMYLDSAYIRVTTQVGNWESGQGGLALSPTNIYKPFRVKVFSGHFGKVDTLQVGFFYQSNSTSINPKGKLIIDEVRGSFNDPVSVRGKDQVDKIAVFPNPFNSKLTIDLGTEDQWEILLTDISGRICYNTSTFAKSHFMDLSSIESGLYILQLSNATERYNQKLFKQ